MGIQKAAKPNYSVLGRINLNDNENGQNIPIYRNIKQYPSSTQTRDDMLMIEWDGSIFFANVASFKKRIRKQIGRFLEENNYPKHWCWVSAELMILILLELKPWNLFLNS